MPFGVCYGHTPVYDGPADPGHEFRERRFLVGKRHRVDAGQPCRAVLAHVGRDLHLPHERQHVGEQPRRKQRVGIDLFHLAIRFGLLEDGRERIEELPKRTVISPFHARSYEAFGFLERYVIIPIGNVGFSFFGV